MPGGSVTYAVAVSTGTPEPFALYPPRLRNALILLGSLTFMALGIGIVADFGGTPSPEDVIGVL